MNIWGKCVLVQNWIELSSFLRLKQRNMTVSLRCSFSALGAQNGQDKLEGTSLGFAESWNKFTYSSRLQFNRYKYSRQLVTGLPGNMLCGSDVRFRSRAVSRLQHQAGLNVSVALMQLHQFCTSSRLVSVSLGKSLHYTLLGEANLSSRNVVILRLFQEKR